MGANKAFTFNLVRFLYPAVLKPKAKYGGNGEEYGLVALIPKTDTAQIERFRAHYNTLAVQEFGSVPGNLRPFTGQSDKSVLKDGDDKYNTVPQDKKENYAAYKGCMFINLSIDVTEGKIEAFDADQNAIISVDQIPNGTFGHIVVECSCYKSPKYGPQFTVRPRIVQVIDASQPIGAPTMGISEALGMLPDSGPSLPPASDVGDLF